MKVGDLVKVKFPDEKPVLGVFIRDDIVVSGFAVRALVLWDGQVYSTPIEQIEIINESR